MKSTWLNKKVTLCSARSQHKGPTVAYSKPSKTAISRGLEWVKSNISKSQSFIDRQQHLNIEEPKVLLQMIHSWTSHKCFIALSRTTNTFKKKKKKKKGSCGYTGALNPFNFQLWGSWMVSHILKMELEEESLRRYFRNFYSQYTESWAHVSVAPLTTSW